MLSFNPILQRKTTNCRGIFDWVIRRFSLSQQ